MHKLYGNIFTHRYLLIGDTIMLVLVTIAGFATHGEIDRFTRMLSTFIPLFFAWFLITPFFGLFNDECIRRPGQLWRVLWAMIAVVPLATWLRGFWLNTPVIPIFVLVLVSISALAMLIWRGFYLISLRWGKQSHG